MRADKPRAAAAMGDMMRSLLVVFAFVAIGFAALLPRGHHDAVKVVDYRGALSEARATAPYAVVAPQGLTAAWRATSAYTDTDEAKHVHWHLGFVTPDGDYAGVEQSNAPADDFVAQQLGEHSGELGALPVGRGTWDQRRADTGRLALVHTSHGVTVIVTGSARMGELVSLATALRLPG